MKWLISLLFLAGCTFNFTISTDYASQNESSGSIAEETENLNETKQSTDVDAKLK